MFARISRSTCASLIYMATVYVTYVLSQMYACPLSSSLTLIFQIFIILIVFVVVIEETLWVLVAKRRRTHCR